MAGTTSLFGSEALRCLLPYVLGSWIIVALLAVLYRAALPKPLPGIPYNQESVGRIFGDLKDMRKAKYRRQWIWSQPRQHGAPLSQAFLFPFRRPTVIVSDYRTAVDICSRRIKEFDRGTRNRECVGVTAPNFHFTMESRDPRFRMHREILRDLMSPWFLNEVGPVGMRIDDYAKHRRSLHHGSTTRQLSSSTFGEQNRARRMTARLLPATTYTWQPWT